MFFECTPWQLNETKYYNLKGTLRILLECQQLVEKKNK
jgi:hypothetical protein